MVYKRKGCCLKVRPQTLLLSEKQFGSNSGTSLRGGLIRNRNGDRILATGP